jgi:hypothetical protein
MIQPDLNVWVEFLGGGSPASGAGGKGLFGAGADTGIVGVGCNGVFRLASRGGLGILQMRVGCRWESPGLLSSRLGLRR